MFSDLIPKLKFLCYMEVRRYFRYTIRNTINHFCKIYMMTMNSAKKPKSITHTEKILVYKDMSQFLPFFKPETF